MLLKTLLQEEKKEEKKVVFVETDVNEPFPSDTMSALEKEINKGAKDLTKTWTSAISLVDNAFMELDVPKPLVYLKKRWSQYEELISAAVAKLKNARGMKGNWVRTV